MRLAEPTLLAAVAPDRVMNVLYLAAWILVLLIVGCAAILGVLRWWRWQWTQPLRLGDKSRRKPPPVDAWVEAAKRVVVEGEDEGDEDDDDEDGEPDALR